MARPCIGGRGTSDRIRHTKIQWSGAHGVPKQREPFCVVDAVSERESLGLLLPYVVRCSQGCRVTGYSADAFAFSSARIAFLESLTLLPSLPLHLTSICW